MGGTDIKDQHGRSLVGGCHDIIKMVNPLKEYIFIHEPPWEKSNYDALDATIIHHLPVGSLSSQYDHRRGGND